jgi:hypothetical protein
MSENVVPFPKREPGTPTSQELVAQLRKHLADGRIAWEVPHFKDQLAARRLTIRQVLEGSRSAQAWRRAQTSPARQAWGLEGEAHSPRRWPQGSGRRGGEIGPLGDNHRNMSPIKTG